MMHYGHANALRQAKALGDYLIVGVHSDAEIRKHKGPPVMSEAERYAAVRACKWVDEVVEDAPYVTSLEWMANYEADFCVHGDDIVCDADGNDTYREVRAAGKFKTVPRTHGVSTTDLVGRMLLLTKSHQVSYNDDDKALGTTPETDVRTMSEGKTQKSPYTRVSHFLPSSRRIVQFSEGRERLEDDKAVYIHGSFDLFHTGHIAILEEAKKLGTYLIVGVLPDHIVNQKKGHSWPVMNLYERVLSVLSCSSVDEVIIGAPWEVPASLIEAQGIHVVVEGSVVDSAYLDDKDADTAFNYPKEIGIYQKLSSPSNITTSDIVTRIIANRQAFIERNKKKEAKEIAELNQSK
eukprot:TRINITY_DN1788_c0_g1_i2.p1 TRINITY_DN1788_c0_g1~~TRINITY_DN1788_c0_g1_i2.p1  ORF type:complete len:350 (-),score=97.59 TRINITY_DN1788_c0_g1_i2:91-1140(-)